MPILTPRLLVRALPPVLALALVACVASCTGPVVPTGRPVLSQGEHEALTAELATLPTGLTRDVRAQDAVATFRGTLADGSPVVGLVTWSDTDCSVGAVGGPFGDGSHGASRVGGPPGTGRTEDEYPTDDLLSAVVDGTGGARLDGPAGTASMAVECGHRGVHVTLDPEPDDLTVTGAATVVAYDDGFPLGVVVGSRSVRAQAERTAARADAPDPAILSLPRLPLADDQAGTLTTVQLRHVVATFQMTAGLSGAVVLDGTSCAVSVTGPAETGGGLGAEPDLGTDDLAQAGSVLLDGVGSMLIGDVTVGFTCTRSAAAVRLVGVPVNTVTAQGAATVVERTDATGDASTVVLAGTAPALRAAVAAAEG